MSGQFIDKVRIFVKGGDGGAGCMSFRREAHVPKGGPDGGDGGFGGNIVLVGDGGKSSLIDFRYKHHFKAQRGTHGKGSKMHGRDGADMYLKVPVGTVVRVVDLEDESADYTQGQICETLADITQDGQEVVVAQGGTGGRGNTHFVTPTRRAPGFAELGEPAVGRWIELEMKLMADAALVGMPSAGKSTLISRLSAARPKIADYPFTTLQPNLGVAKAGKNSYVLADIPGLIKGASMGKGLGHEFLRHIERTALIVHIVDMTGSWEGRDPVEDFMTINEELEAYGNGLDMRPQIVVANKTDIPEIDGDISRLQQAVQKRADNDCGTEREGLTDPKLYCISAATGKGVDELNYVLAQRVHNLRAAATDVEDKDAEFDKVWTLPRRSRDDDFQVVMLSPNIYEVLGKKPVRAVVQTDLENEEAVIFLQHRLKRMGVERALAAAGAVDGDEIRICDRCFEFENTEAAGIEDEYGDMI